MLCCDQCVTFYVAASMFAKEVCDEIGWCTNGRELFKHRFININNSISKCTSNQGFKIFIIKILVL